MIIPCASAFGKGYLILDSQPPTNLGTPQLFVGGFWTGVGAGGVIGGESGTAGAIGPETGALTGATLGGVTGEDTGGTIGAATGVGIG